MKKKLSDKLTFDALASLLGIREYDSIHEGSLDYIFSVGDYASEQALKEGATEAEAEEAGMKGQEEADASLFKAYEGALESAADDAFEKVGLVLVPLKSGYEFQIKPKKDWKDAANEIRELINGYGPFYFATLKEFLDSGPYTAREAVLSHLGWVKDYGAVYGDRSPQAKFERDFENATRYL